MLFFANSQRSKRYVSIPRESPLPRPSPSPGGGIANFRVVNCVGGIKPPKKAGRPATLDLNPNFEILSQMRTFTVQFLDDDGQYAFKCFHFKSLTFSDFRLQGILSDAIIRPDDWMI
jgi:hypothetical protein